MHLRVTGGTARGLILKSPKGAGTRPTADRVRSALFSILQPHHLGGTRVLDLYAGTGSLGIEALSRGATSADFVEGNRACCALITENLQHTRFTSQGRVYCGPVARILPTLPLPYDIVLLDPPYADLSLLQILGTIESHRSFLSPGALVCVEHGRQSSPLGQYRNLSLWTSRSYGSTKLSIYQRGGSDDNGSLSR